MLVFLTAAAFMVAGSTPAATATTEDEAAALQLLAPRLQGKHPDAMRPIIIETFGNADRNVGSGLRIEQWDVAGGVLTFHPLGGPTFEKEGAITRLIRTTNLAKDCVFGEYSISTLPDPENYGNQYGLGGLSISTDGRYRYVDSSQTFLEHVVQPEALFIRHPQGSVTVAYLENVTGETRLEDLPQGTAIAVITLTSADRGSDRGSKEAYRVIAHPSVMRLSLEGEDGRPTPFSAYKGWPRSW
jgi:hypothetical protein